MDLYKVLVVCTFFVFFFFQAEDGIRDVAVTGVQTCALPICCRSSATTSSRPRPRDSCSRARLTRCKAVSATVSGRPRRTSPRSTEDPQEVLSQDLPDVVVAVTAGPQGRNDQRQRRHVFHGGG